MAGAMDGPSGKGSSRVSHRFHGKGGAQLAGKASPDFAPPRRRRPTARKLFSHAFAEFAAAELPRQLHTAVIAATQCQRLIGHITRDSTAIPAPERISETARQVEPTTRQAQERGQAGQDQAQSPQRCFRPSQGHRTRTPDQAPAPSSPAPASTNAHSRQLNHVPVIAPHPGPELCWAKQERFKVRSMGANQIRVRGAAKVMAAAGSSPSQLGEDDSRKVPQKTKSAMVGLEGSIGAGAF